MKTWILFLSLVFASAALADSCPQDGMQQADQPISQPNLTTVAAGTQAASIACADGLSADEAKRQSELQTNAPEVPAYSIANPSRLSWESASHPERKLWSDYAFASISAHLKQLSQAKDIGYFCPNYDKLSRDQQVMAWAQIVVGVSQFESSWDPKERTREDMGNDEITGQPVYSEGLLQLSYQDAKPWGGATCPFDWPHDKKLSTSDPDRTIFNPYSNLYCGIDIMANLAEQQKGIVLPSQNGYWSTLTPNGAHSKVKSIAAGVRKTLPFCGARIHEMPVYDALWKFGKFKPIREIFKDVRTVRSKLRTSPSGAATPSAQPAASPSGN